MAYEKVVDLSTDTVVKLGGVDNKTNKPNPTSMEGYYLGFRSVKSDTGTSLIHVFQTPKGNQGVWGTADLNSKLGTIALGTQTLVEYKGKKKLAGGKTKHMYDVSRDPENVIDVPKSASTVTSSYADDEDDRAESEDYESDYETAEVAQTQALAAAERKAAVMAKLNANKSK